jgi:nucleoside-diphosphate-sugar epimerase
MKIIVLGATGQIGSLIYNGLKGFHDVIGTSRKPSNELIQFDPFSDDWSALGKADVLINCVGQIEQTASSSLYHIHVDLTRLIIANRENLCNPRIVQISALGALSAHEVEFLKTKGIADDLLLQHWNTVVVRPSIVCTHRTMIVKKMLMLANLSRFLFGVVPVPKGFLETKIQPIMPQDLVELIQRVCVTLDSRILDAVGMESLSFREIIQLLVKSTERSFKIIEVPKAASDVVVKTIMSWLLPGAINAQQYQLLFHDNVADVEPCTQLMGRKPKSCREFFEREFYLLNK